MNASLTLIESRDNGSYEHKLLFNIKTELFEIDVLNFSLYSCKNYTTSPNYVTIANNNFEYDGYIRTGVSLKEISDRLKKFVNDISNNKKSKLNFLYDCDNNFYGFIVENNILTVNYELVYPEFIIPKINCKIFIDNKFLNDIRIIINQLNILDLKISKY